MAKDVFYCSIALGSAEQIYDIEGRCRRRLKANVVERKILVGQRVNVKF